MATQRQNPSERAALPTEQAEASVPIHKAPESVLGEGVGGTYWLIPLIRGLLP